MDLDQGQRRVVDFEGARLKVLGGAATGKTTALVERAARLVDDGADPAGVLVFTFNRRAAMSLRDRLVRRLGRSVAGPSVMTFHAFAWSLLTRGFPVQAPEGTSSDVGYQLAGYTDEPVLLTAFDQRALVAQLLAEEEPADWPVNGALLSSRSFAGEVRDFLLRVQERLDTPSDIRRLAAERGREDWGEIAGFYGRYLSKLDDGAFFGDGRPRLDFARVLVEARRVIGEHDALAADLETVYPHVLVDDFEEGNRAELALLEALLPPSAGDGLGRSAVVAGDVNGSVSGFRGADPRCLADLEAELATLGVAHRRREAPELKLFPHVTEEARGIVAHLRQAAAAGTSWGDMAVIVRDYRTMLGPLRRELNIAGVPHRVDGEALDLPSDPVVRPILTLFSIACRRPGHHEQWPSLLTSELGGVGSHELAELRRIARLRGAPLETICADPQAARLPAALEAKITGICSLVSEAARWVAGQSPDDCFWRLWTSSDRFAPAVAGDDDRRLDSLTTLADALARFTERRGPAARMADFLETLSSADFAPESVRLDRAHDALSITTAHATKGRELELAVVADCVEGAWPDPSRRGLLLDLDLLDGPKSHAERRRAALEEEERLFELATSRATRVLLTGRRAGGSERTSAEPSRFVSRLVEEIPESNSEVPSLMFSEAEIAVAWRRTLADALASPARRLAAVSGLAALPGVDTKRWWSGRAWTKNAVPVAGEHKKTSYSRYSSYDNCGLQYLLGQVLGLDPETTFYMAYGSLIHTLLEDLERGELPADLEALVAEAKRRWRPEAYPPGAVSEWLKRDCTEILDRYLRLEMGNGHKTLRVEEKFEFDVAGWTVRGKIDRIDEVYGNGLRLCDYKTGRFKRDQDVADDLQLSTYFLACMRDESLRKLGTPKTAELLYLRYQDGNKIKRATMQRPKSPDDGRPWDEVVEERVGGLIEGIDAERFSPSPEANCHFCSFKPICPMWPEGRELTA